MSTCNICCDSYNKSTRSKICCAYCDFDACRTCCETYILSEMTPKCMNPNCAKEWSRKFIRENFTNVFITTKYKEHLENILYDQERALLPATQPLVEERLRKEKVRKEIAQLSGLINDLYKQKGLLEQALYNPNYNADEPKEKGHAHFVRQCPSKDCRGFLSTQWKCGICEQWTCPDCHELKGLNRDSDHTCDPNSVETAKLLAKDSKPCPKCHSLIFKISGCFAKDTPILMWDGTIKPAQDILVGDAVVGDDGSKRTVTELVTGEDNLYQIKQTNGISYTVNSKHTLVLKVKNLDIEVPIVPLSTTNPHETSDIRLITAEDYLKLDTASQKNLCGYKFMKNKNVTPKTDIKVTHVGTGTYYGWSITGNHRFLLSDFTVVKNCDQMWCTQCHTAFSWKTGAIEKVIHNPHYYEWQRKNGTNQRNPNDVECGRELDHHTIARIEDIVEDQEHTDLKQLRDREQRYWCSSSRSYKTRFTKEMGYVTNFENILRIIRNTIHNIRAEIHNFQTDYVQRNQALRIQFLMNEIDEEELKMIIQRNDKKNKKNTEIAQVIQLSNTAVTDIIYRFKDHLKNSEKNKYNLDTFYQEFEELRKYCNDILKDIGFTYNCVQYGFNEVFNFSKVEKEKKQRKKKEITAANDDDDSSTEENNTDYNTDYNTDSNNETDFTSMKI